MNGLRHTAALASFWREVRHACLPVLMFAILVAGVVVIWEYACIPFVEVPPHPKTPANKSWKAIETYLPMTEAPPNGGTTNTTAFQNKRP